MSDLVIGALVRWAADKQTFGVVRDITDRLVVVEWDESGPPERFSRENSPLERHELKPGGEVVQRSSGRRGFVVSGGGEDGGLPKWEVRFLDGEESLIVTEADLRPVVKSDPLSRMRRRADDSIGSAKQINLALTARYYRQQHFNNDLVSLAAAQVDLKPHQVSVIHRVVHSSPHRFLLCDEVGLGKTIEAGMIFKELEMRGQVRRTLVIVPANLQRQWQFEMKSKFNAGFAILNTATVPMIRQRGYENPFMDPWCRNVIVSERWITREPWVDYVAEVGWDLIIVDEAHHARQHADGHTTKLFHTVEALADESRLRSGAMLMLSATPMQLHSHELFSLIGLLDPELFPSEESVRQHQEQLPELNRALGELNKGVPQDASARSDLARSVAAALEISQQEAGEQLDKGESGAASLREQLWQKHSLSEVLIRNRKKVVGGFLGRQAYTWEVKLTDGERNALQSVEEYVQNAYASADRAQTPQERTNINFAMVIFQKLMASSRHALRCSLDRRRARLSEEVSHGATSGGSDGAYEDDGLTVDAVDRPGAIVADEVSALTVLIDSLDALGETDSKARIFLEQMDQLQQKSEGTKVLVFTQFRDTQDYLAELLRARGWGVSLFHGQLKPAEKDASVDQFRAAKTPHILLSTEAGGEGRNFQFCHLLVNYDLPWNPMRVEQRIGRVDRIGQNSVVQIFNLSVEGTIEERVLNVLDQRINVFEQTVGGLDAILGESTEKNFREIFRLSAEMREREMKKWADNMQQRVHEARRAEEQLQDLIMDTKSFSRELAKRIKDEPSPIGAEEQERFMKNLLKGMGASLSPKKPHGVWQLHFKDPFLSNHEDRLFPLGPMCQAVLRPDMHTDSESVEYFAFGHPVVDTAIKEVLSPAWDGCAGGLRVVSEGDLRAGSGWLFVWEAEIPDIKKRREMVPIFVEDGGAADLSLGHALVEHAACFSDDQDIDPDKIPTDNLSHAHGVAKNQFAEWSRETEASAKHELAGKIKSEERKITRYFDFRDRTAAENKAAREKQVAESRASADENMRKVLPIRESELEKATALAESLVKQRADRLKALADKKAQNIAETLVGAYRVEILPPGKPE